MIVDCSLPPITLTRPDRDRLKTLLGAELGRRSRSGRALPVGLALLTREVMRASVVPAERVEPQVVTMDSFVAVQDVSSGHIRHVGLTYPGETDPARDEVSVLSPLGAALLGLSEGQSIGWRTERAPWREISVRRVHHQPESASGRWRLRS